MLLHHGPIIKGVLWIRFSAHHHALGMARMVGFIFFRQVVVARNVEINEGGIRKLVPVLEDFPPICANRLGDEPGRIVRQNRFAQPLRRRFVAELFRDFVADGPQDDRCMIAVTPHHRVNVALRPALEEPVIILFVVLL